MAGTVADMVGKALAGLLVLLALAVIAPPAPASPLRAALHSQLELAHNSQRHRLSSTPVVQQARTAPCSCPARAGDPLCCTAMCSAAAAVQVPTLSALPPAPLPTGPGTFLGVGAEPDLGTDIGPAPPPPRQPV